MLDAWFIGGIYGLVWLVALTTIYWKQNLHKEHGDGQIIVNVMVLLWPVTVAVTAVVGFLLLPRTLGRYLAERSARKTLPPVLPPPNCVCVPGGTDPCPPRPPGNGPYRGAVTGGAS